MSGLAFSPDSNRLATGGDTAVMIWQLNADTAPVRLNGHTSVIASVAFSPDGRHLVSGGADRIVRVWEVQTQSEVHSFRGHKNWVSSVAYSKDGYFIVSAGVDETLKVWELGGKTGTSGYGHSREVRAVVVSPDGRLCASGAADNSVHVWETATGRELHTLTGHNKPIAALIFTADSKLLVSAANDEKSLRVWDMATGKEARVVADLGNDVPVLAAVPGGKRVAAWVASAQVDVIDVVEGKPVLTFEAHDKPTQITCLTFSSDGSMAAIGGQDGKVRLWNVMTKEKLGDDILATTPNGLTDLALTPDKKTLVAADDKGEVKVWDIDKRTATHTIKTSPKKVIALAMSPDGKHFATVGEENVVRLWDVAKGTEVRAWDFKTPWRADKPFVRTVAFTPDGKQVLTANANATLYLLDCP